MSDVTQFYPTSKHVPVKISWEFFCCLQSTFPSNKIIMGKSASGGKYVSDLARLIKKYLTVGPFILLFLSPPQDLSWPQILINCRGQFHQFTPISKGPVWWFPLTYHLTVQRVSSKWKYCVFYLFNGWNLHKITLNILLSLYMQISKKSAPPNGLLDTVTSEQ